MKSSLSKAILAYEDSDMTKMTSHMAITKAGVSLNWRRSIKEGNTLSFSEEREDFTEVVWF